MAVTDKLGGSLHNPTTGSNSCLCHALYRSQDVGKTWQRFDKVTPHGTLMSVGLHHGDAKQVYVAARYGEVMFGTQDGGESWLEMPLPKGVQHIYALACG
jgi:photosystem II stability/assembly factor-like uncharacterized protein